MIETISKKESIEREESDKGSLSKIIISIIYTTCCALKLCQQFS